MKLTKQIAGTPVKKHYIRHGKDGIVDTLRIMKKIINESSKNWYVRRWAEKIVENACCEYDRAYLIYRFVQDNSKYLRDPFGFEYIRTPLVSLRLIEQGELPQLDCDDATVLVLSLLKSIGFPVRMIVAVYETKDRYPGTNELHVYGSVFIKKKGWVSVDASNHEAPLGWSFPNPIWILYSGV